MFVENLRKKFSLNHTKPLTVYQVKVQIRILKMEVKALQKACTDRSTQVKLFAGKFLYSEQICNQFIIDYIIITEEDYLLN